MPALRWDDSPHRGWRALHVFLSRLSDASSAAKEEEEFEKIARQLERRDRRKKK